jgi:hypothetical protein
MRAQRLALRRNEQNKWKKLINLSGEVRIIRISPFFDIKMSWFKASDENAQSIPVHVGQL